MPDFDFILLRKGEHRYIITYESDCKEAVQNRLMNYAQSPDYNLNLEDALLLIKKMDQIGKKS